MAPNSIDSFRYTGSTSGVTFLVLCLASLCNSNHDARRLYDDLLRKNKYNRLIRPVGNSTDKLTVKMGLKLAQVLDVNERTQVITTNLWVVQEWKDDGLQWDPVEYGGVKTLYVPSESIWLPDIVLYNNADGDYTVTIMTKATLSYYGMVHWEPPVIFKSHCEIEVEFFPFDIQHCHMKFGSWSYDGFQVDLVHIWQEMLGLGELALIDLAVDLSDFYRSVEWDLLNAHAKKNIVRYPCCEEPYPDITFNLTLRRKTLFYTINLLIPCISINTLTILGFYLPSDAGEKISLCISILLSLSIFQLLLMEIVPATSLTIPLMGKYILFTSVLLSISIFSSVITLNVNFRSTSKPKMPRLTRRIFLEILPRILCMHRPDTSSEQDPDEKEGLDWSTAHSELPDLSSLYRSSHHVTPDTASTSSGHNIASTSSGHNMASTFVGLQGRNVNMSSFCDACADRRHNHMPPNARKALEGANFIAKHLGGENESKRVRDEWKYVALVIDRILLIIYVTVCILGGMGILLRAPALYDYRMPLTRNSFM
ncbi:hypothetical protein NP493_304g07002 [Ridgeia piscesae]|uniref:Uncharacterized protein n=1 Tax=Ridgeia piscesae TaxID=27915 RepID=A0AAD9L593_RIDPI|nr:hypothetical protein NP493_304g07002 [Ridgeia piscesae]